LTSWARLAKFKGIFEQSGPIKPNLQHFFGSLAGTKVSTTCNLVTEEKNTLDFLVRDVSPSDMVKIIFKKIRFLSKETPDLR